jgi:hypothetical protein
MLPVAESLVEQAQEGQGLMVYLVATDVATAVVAEGVSLLVLREPEGPEELLGLAVAAEAQQEASQMEAVVTAQTVPSESFRGR